MGYKKYGKWYGRPNKPPLNWHTPDKPVIRKVTGSLGARPNRSSRPSRPPRPRRSSRPPRLSHPPHPPSPDDRDLVAITLTNDHWICLLKALYLYGKAHGDGEWKKWRMRVRGTILGTVNPNRDDSNPVAVKLPLEDWRKIWQQVRVACQECGEEWTAWFDWLSHTMTTQIKNA
jgi:hypothetical protein